VNWASENPPERGGSEESGNASDGEFGAWHNLLGEEIREDEQKASQDSGERKSHALIGSDKTSGEMRCDQADEANDADAADA